jgi:hypothetical protein
MRRIQTLPRSAGFARLVGSSSVYRPAKAIGNSVALLVFVLILKRAASDAGFVPGWQSATQPIK